MIVGIFYGIFLSISFQILWVKLGLPFNFLTGFAIGIVAMVFGMTCGAIAERK